MLYIHMFHEPLSERGLDITTYLSSINVVYLTRSEILS